MLHPSVAETVKREKQKVSPYLALTFATSPSGFWSFSPSLHLFPGAKGGKCGGNKIKQNEASALRGV